MAPALVVNDRILVNKLAYRIGRARRGDVAVFRAPAGAVEGARAGADYVKRVIALPGDTVEVRRFQGVFLNGKPPEESYVAQPASYDWGPVRVPPGKCAALGDNRNGSNDSHLWGFLPIANIRGKVSVRFWPLARTGKVR